MAPTERPKRGLRFWMIMLGLVISYFMAFLEATVVATALPTIADDLHAKEFVWVGTAYALAFAALLPMSGSLAEAFGRRPVLLTSLSLFGLGSALAGAAQTMNWLVAARTISGMGAAGIGASSTIIISDIVPLQERGLFIGLLGLMWCIGGGIGPVVGGSLAQQGQWRWAFFIILPLSGLAIALVILFFKLPTPTGSFWEKLGSIDWLGTVIVAGSSTAIILGLTWGGVQFPWVSPQVLVPLIVGGIGLVAFFLYEFRCAKNPLVPFHVLSNRTSLSGYLQTFILTIPLNVLSYFLPVYYQACKAASPTASGVDILGVSLTVAPISVLAGISVSYFKVYRPQLWTGWCISIIGLGLLSSLHADSPRAAVIGYEAVTGVGIGLAWSTVYFPVLAPLAVEDNARALSLYGFLRTFSQAWGIAIGGTILQNALLARLPPAFTALFPPNVQIAYAVIPQIPDLPPDIREEVAAAFAASLATLWRAMIAVSGLGLVTSLFMKGLPIQKKLDKKWQAKEDGEDDLEKVVENEVVDKCNSATDV